MSIEQLRDDLKANLASVKTVDPTNPIAVMGHLKNTLWPFLESLVDELTEIDESVAELVDGVDEVLTFESGKVFAGIIAGGLVMTQMLEAQAAADPKIRAAINEWKSLAEQGGEILDEITLPEGYDDEDAETGDDEPDADDDAEDDDEGADHE